MQLHYDLLETNSPAGTLLLAESERGLAVLSFRPQETLASKKMTCVRDAAALRPYIAHLREFLAGDRRDFDVPLDLRGTEFQLRCWNQLLKIPFGEVITYAQLAQRVGSPNGFRAVGHANGQNPIAIVVPCHRVVRTGGGLGGYGGGLQNKQLLLDLESSR